MESRLRPCKDPRNGTQRVDAPSRLQEALQSGALLAGNTQAAARECRQEVAGLGAVREACLPLCWARADVEAPQLIHWGSSLEVIDEAQIALYDLAIGLA